MSLIQEALRRQQEEKEAASQKDTARVAGAAPAPAEGKPVVEPEAPAAAAPAARKLTLPARPPMPSDTAPEAPAPEPPLRRTATEKKHRVLLPLLGVFLVLLLLAGLAVRTVLYGLQMFSGPDDVGEPVPVEAPDATEPTEPLPDDAMEQAIAEVAPTDEAPDEAADEAADDPADPADVAEADVAEADAAEADAAEPDAEIAPQPEVPTPPAVVDAPPPAEPTPAPEPVIWPEVHVSGVIGAGSSGSAIINGKVLGRDDTIGDLTVRDFGRGFVILEYQGETRRFTVGRSLR